MWPTLKKLLGGCLDIRAIRIPIAIVAFIIMNLANGLSQLPFSMDILLKRIPSRDKLRLSKSQGASTPAELKRMQNVPYALAVRSIMYDVPVDWKECQAKHLRYFILEASNIAAYDASKEAIWVRKFISGLGVVPIIEEPINMYCDNTRAITIANESWNH
ncbi:hypothetical protein Tco_0139529 [Tanacetum coccineum]